MDYDKLRNKILSEETNSAIRPYLIDYIKYNMNRIQGKTAVELAGTDIAYDVSDSILRGLLFHYNGGLDDNPTETERWFTDNSEPILADIFHHAGRLDAGYGRDSDIKDWQGILDAYSQLLQSEDTK